MRRGASWHAGGRVSSSCFARWDLYEEIGHEIAICNGLVEAAALRDLDAARALVLSDALLAATQIAKIALSRRTTSSWSSTSHARR
jgi:hypothetical protein